MQLMVVTNFLLDSKTVLLHTFCTLPVYSGLCVLYIKIVKYEENNPKKLNVVKEIRLLALYTGLMPKYMVEALDMKTMESMRAELVKMIYFLNGRRRYKLW